MDMEAVRSFAASCSASGSIHGSQLLCGAWPSKTGSAVEVCHEFEPLDASSTVPGCEVLEAKRAGEAEEEGAVRLLGPSTLTEADEGLESYGSVSLQQASADLSLGSLVLVSIHKYCYLLWCCVHLFCGTLKSSPEEPPLLRGEAPFAALGAAWRILAGPGPDSSDTSAPHQHRVSTLLQVNGA